MHLDAYTIFGGFLKVISGREMRIFGSIPSSFL